MAGCRALTKAEISKILNTLTHPRDRALFILGIATGFRISELLSVKVTDVLQFGEVVTHLRVRAMYMKRKERTREVVLTDSARQAIRELLSTLPEGSTHLFRSREGGDKAISRGQAHTILKNAFNQLELNGKLATHSMRKTFCEGVHKALGNDIYKTSQAMGHENINSTVKYLKADKKEIEKAILSMGQ